MFNKILISNFMKPIKYFMMLPLYWLSFFIPKNKNLWIFGSWFGERYSDNSKYLFEYVNKYHPEIQSVWITKNKNVIKILREKGYRVYSHFSLLGLYYSLRANIGIVSTGLWDINIYLTGNLKIVQLWHGTPLKKIMYDDKISFRGNRNLRKFVYNIFPFLKRNVDYSDSLIIATSTEVQKILSSAFKVAEKNIKITGYPRNDAFFEEKEDIINFVKTLLELKSSGKMLAIYMPTHRREGELDTNELFFSNVDELNKKLRELNVVLLIKPHFYHEENIKYSKFSNIIIVNNKLIEDDIYQILKYIDILITDYSSVFFDFLLLNRPIIFTPFDLEDYVKNDREMYYDYDKVTPGPKARNWNEVIVHIEEIIKYPDKYKGKRQKIRDLFHEYKDGNSSARVYREIIKFFDK